MTGKYKVKIWEDKRLYSFYVDRQVTILTGHSGIGKTSLFNMLWDSVFIGNPAVNIECEKDIKPVALPIKDWAKVLDLEDDSIILIDETSTAIYTKEFADYIKGSNNYYIIITRDLLQNIPYSVKSVYTLSSSKNEITNVWEYTFENLYKFGTKHIPDKIENIIVEDKCAGYEFFSILVNKSAIVISSEGNGNIIKSIIGSSKKVLIIVDGSAFGPYMKDCYRYLEKNTSCMLWAPESFEWLLLNSECLNNIIQNIKELKDVLEHPYDYVDSCKYFTYERFFTAYLINATHGVKGWQYSKSELADGYKSEKFISAFKERYKNILRLE